MSDESGLKEVVIEEVSDQVDVATLVENGSLKDQIDASEVGSAVGGRFGEQLGRELGEAIGEKIHEALASATAEDTEFREIRADLVAAVRSGVTDVLGGDGDGSGAFRSLVEEVAEASGAEGITEGDGADSDLEEADEAEPEDEGRTEESTDEADEGEDRSDEADSEGDADAVPESDVDPEELDDITAADLREFRTETLEELLSMASYSDLQSIAKDVDVRANLSREEMTERIVETISEEEEE